MTMVCDRASPGYGDSLVNPEQFESDECFDLKASDNECRTFSSQRSNHDFQICRLASARTLVMNRINCIVWGRDALEFAHGAESSLTDCHLLVDDQQLHDAAELLIHSLGYVHTEPDPTWFEIDYFNPAHPHPHPDSVRLRHMSAINPLHDEVVKYVLLTPMSYFHVDRTWYTCNSKTMSLANPEVNRALRFPTLHGYLDALIATYLEPRHGRHKWLAENLLVEITTLRVSWLGKKDDTGVGVMSKADQGILVGVRKENQPFLKRVMVRCRDGCWLQHQKERRMILTGMYSLGGCSCIRCAETTIIE